MITYIFKIIDLDVVTHYMRIDAKFMEQALDIARSAYPEGIIVCLNEAV